MSIGPRFSLAFDPEKVGLVIIKQRLPILAGGSYQHVLKMVDLAVMPNDKCQENLRTYTRLNSTFVLHDSFLCAGGQQGVDTCQGDGGGPLVCLAKDGVSYIQV